jgi:hypothetical protein
MLMMTRWDSVSLAIILALLVSFWMDTTFGGLGMTQNTQIARPERQPQNTQIERDWLALELYDHHKIIQPVPSPASHPAHPPLTEARAQRNGYSKSQILRLQFHVWTP